MPVIPELIRERTNFRPFRYPQAFAFHQAQQKVHWLPEEVSFGSDIQEYHLEFTVAEKHAVSTILKTFTRVETLVSEYWSGVVAKWFKHPEISMMGHTFASFEAIHAEAYDKLNVELGLDSHEFYISYLDDPVMVKKQKIIETALHVESVNDLPLSLAIFSAFTEGVSLYSQFAILLNFQRFNKLKNVANIIAWSVRDESLHSKAGCWLFRTLVQELGGMTPELREQIIKSSEIIYELECAALDGIFSLGEFCELDKENLKNFVHNRIVSKLKELGIDGPQPKMETVSKWFNELVDGVEHVDFFESRSSSYVKSWNFSNIEWK